VKQETFNHYSLKEKTGQKAGDSIVSPYREKLSGEMNKVVAVSYRELTKDNSQSMLGNFVCDALKYSGDIDFKTRADLVLANRGGFRSNLPKGDITAGNIFEMVPFDNHMVLVKVSGEKLLSGLKTIVSKRHSYLGLKLVLKKDSILDVKLNGKPIEPTAMYTIITSDFLANGGDNFNFLANPLEIRVSDLLFRDAIIKYCLSLTAGNEQIIPYTDDRLRETE
jgi:2',3'-cyclic-nucleotide 2'-phosphodiesterase (5'-nucleotidase family)